MKYFYPSARQLSDYDYFVGGAGGGVGKSFFWRSTDRPDMKLNARNLAMRFGMPMHEEVVEATETWTRQAPDVDGFVLLDLAYLELRLSPWNFVGIYGADPGVERVEPIVSREAFHLMLELSPEAKRSGAMFVEAVRSRWPELLDLPINRYGDYRDTLRLARRAARNPRLILQKLRRMYG